MTPMLVLLLLLAFLLGVIVATKWIERRIPDPIPPDSVWVNDRWYSAKEITAMSMEEYVELRPQLLPVRPEGWEDIELDAQTIRDEQERMMTVTLRDYDIVMS